MSNCFALLYDSKANNGKLDTRAKSFDACENNFAFIINNVDGAKCSENSCGNTNNKAEPTSRE